MASLAILLASLPVWSETFQWGDDTGVIPFSDNATSLPANKCNAVTSIDDSCFDSGNPPKAPDKPTRLKNEAKPAEDIAVNQAQQR